jgi:hypothetical protein
MRLVVTRTRRHALVGLQQHLASTAHTLCAVIPKLCHLRLACFVTSLLLVKRTVYLLSSNSASRPCGTSNSSKFPYMRFVLLTAADVFHCSLQTNVGRVLTVTTKWLTVEEAAVCQGVSTCPMSFALNLPYQFITF